MSPEGPLVLVVDDEEDTCRNLADILGDFGCRVETASDGASALRMARARPYDVALLDLRMPGMSGLDLCEAIRSLGKGTVPILVTAYASRQATDAAREAGAWRIVSKPVDLPALLRMVDDAARVPLVLVVDDDRELCANLCDVLRDRGFRVAVAHDGPDAAARLAEHAFSVVIVDQRLPIGSGDEVLRRVHESTPTAHTILITGFPAAFQHLSAESWPRVDLVCFKPLDVERLLATIQELASDETPGGSTP